MTPVQARAEVQIVNQKGLHARPSSLVVQTANAYDAELSLRVDGRVANGKSVMEVIMLACPSGTRVLIEAEGPDAEAAVEAVAQLIRSGFRGDD